LVVYTAYEPSRVSRDRIERATQIVFVKDGFTWLAAIAPAIWFLIKGLWLELILFLVGATALTWGVEAAGADSAIAGVLLLIVQIVLGFEAGAVQGAALERRGWRLVGTVTGHNQDDCERRFFETWQPSEPAQPTTAGDGPAQHGVASWTATAWNHARGALARGRTVTGAKA
jgi:hypothetical protein